MDLRCDPYHAILECDVVGSVASEIGGVICDHDRMIVQ